MWGWRKGLRPTLAMGGLAERPPPDARELAGIGRDARQQGNPPDPDLNHPNPKIPDARHIGGHRESTIYDGFPRSRAVLALLVLLLMVLNAPSTYLVHMGVF